MPEAVHQKVLLARRNHQPVYIYGATGFGKTMIIKKYLNFRKYYYISGNTIDSLVHFDAEDKTEQKILVLDDLHVVRNRQIREWIIETLQIENLWVFLVSRAQIPAWLLRTYVMKNMVVITEEDLKLTADDV